jgi:preprotein translocase subunit SecD
MADPTPNRGGCSLVFWSFGLLIGGFFLLAALVGTVSSVPVSPVTSSLPSSPTQEAVLVPIEGTASPEQMQATLAVVETRLKSLQDSGALGQFSTRLTPELTLVVQLAEGDQAIQEIVFALIEDGQLELVDFTNLTVGSGQIVGQPVITSAAIARGEHSDVNDSPQYPTLLTNEDILRATPFTDDFGNVNVQVDLTPDAAALLGDFSEAHIGTPLGIVLDGVVLMAPTLQSRVETPVIISGEFTQAEAQVLATQLNSDPLPVALTLASLNFITP